MARRARILCTICDHFRDEWDVRRIECADAGFDVYQGWPSHLPRGPHGTGGPSWILTDPLAAWVKLNAVGFRTKLHELPFKRGAVDRMRRLLGIDRHSARWQWWRDREADVLTLTNAEFCRRHGYTEDMVTFWRRRLGHPPRLHADGWYLGPDVLPVLASATLPLAAIADAFGLSVKTVWQIRYILRTRHGVEIMDRRGVIV